MNEAMFEVEELKERKVGKERRGKQRNERKGEMRRG